MKASKVLLILLAFSISCVITSNQIHSEDLEMSSTSNNHSDHHHGNHPPSDCLAFIVLGTKVQALDKDFIKSNNIVRVLTIATTREMPDIEKKVDGVEYSRIAISDDGTDSLKPHLEEVFTFLRTGEERHERTLIHCIEGKSRSPSLLIAYLMSEKKFSLKEAYRILKKKYPFISPRYQFFQELLDLELEIRGENSMSHEDNYVPILLGPPL